MRKAKRFVTVSIEPVQDKIPQPRKEEVAKIPVDVPAHTDSVVIEESQPSVLTPVIRPSAAMRTEADDILLSDADSECMIQVVQETAVVTEVFLAEVHEDTTRHDV